MWVRARVAGGDVGAGREEVLRHCIADPCGGVHGRQSCGSAGLVSSMPAAIFATRWLELCSDGSRCQSESQWTQLAPSVPDVEAMMIVARRTWIGFPRPRRTI